MAKNCDYSYPTSTCMSAATSTKFKVDMHGQMTSTSRCIRHSNRIDGYATEEEARAAYIANKLTENA